MNKKWLVLLFIVFLNFLGATIPYPIFAPLFLHPAQGGLISLNLSSAMQKYYLGLTLATYPLGQFFGAPIIGRLSDQLSRKKVLVFILFSAAIGYMLTAYSLQIYFLPLLLIGRFITGFLETGFIIVQAYIVDLKIDKHKGFGAIAAMGSMGSLIGPLLGGTLANKSLVAWFSYSLPFYIAIIPTVFAAIITLITIPEKSNKKTESKDSWLQRLNIYQNYTKVTKNNTVKWLFINSIFLYLGVDTFYEFYPALLVVRWHFMSTQIAMIMLVLCIGLSIGSFFISRAISNKLDINHTIYLGVGIFLVIYISFLLTQNYWFLYFQFIIIGICFGVINTHYVVLISNSVSASEQGEVMGIRFGLRTLGDALTSLLGGFLLTISIHLPLLLVLILFIIFLCLFYYLRKHKQHNVSNKETMVS